MLRLRPRKPPASRRGGESWASLPSQGFDFLIYEMVAELVACVCTRVCRARGLNRIDGVHIYSEILSDEL